MKLLKTLCLALPLLCSSLFAEQTLSIIKPDAVSKHAIGEVISRFEDKGIRIAALKMTKLSKQEASQFYAEHEGKPFFSNLVDFMTSGPIVVMVLEGDNVILKNRELMGATDPSAAKDGTLRADFGDSTTRNAVHGSDSENSAKREIAFFFQSNQIFS